MDEEDEEDEEKEHPGERKEACLLNFKYRLEDECGEFY